MFNEQRLIQGQRQQAQQERQKGFVKQDWMTVATKNGENVPRRMKLRMTIGAKSARSWCTTGSLIAKELISGI